jgi:hypothetical protein
MNTLELGPDLIADFFKGTNFGGAEKTDVGRRGLMVDCVLKRAAGYHDGHTIVSICKDAKLLCNTGKPSSAGLRWAFDQLHFPGARPTILERLRSSGDQRKSG